MEETGLQHFLNSKLPVYFEVGSAKMYISDILSLGQGSVLELQRKVGEALNIYVGKNKVAEGEVVVMPDGAFAARVIKVLPVTEEMRQTIKT